MLDWIVIPATANVMTPVDWMLIVLSIYLHDAGLVVTKGEFERRTASGFPSFKRSILEAPDPTPYQDRISRLDPSEAERFLYQEFVRTNHARRIRCWINGENSDEFGIASEAKAVVAQVVSLLDPTFKDDLALICESHHLNDLNELAKYNPRRAYGSDPKEQVNLQFGAILLRTVDLLHVTRDRTPSVSFQLTTPSDPKSAEEWSKQMSVVAVRKMLPRDDTGKVDREAVPDTIEISATFNDPLGFFSLTEYLSYAEGQLRQSHQWAEQTKANEAIDFVFPWRKIDSSQVRAIGFESRPFAFQLDKPKILNLLTGHTLYSNSNVVVRELVQNALDATRLQATLSPVEGVIELRLDTFARVLTVDDNGTGMTQQIIEEHFFNVGSSRYRDDNFRKQHPQFSAISRFGIGILSTFMISDEIDVIARSAGDIKARNISIRSINGRYLIRLVEPTDPSVPSLIRKHGTRIQLRVRAGAPLPELKEIAEMWVVFPGCQVTVQVDDEPQSLIGYKAPKLALEHALDRAGFTISDTEPEEYTSTFKVVEHERNGVAIAFALEWSHYYRSWSFAGADRLNSTGRRPDQPLLATAVCVHGIRVEDSSPGFTGPSILAISNVTGLKAPATNVARSSLEAGALLDEMLANIYACYGDHISTEIKEMSENRRFSISRAASEGRYLLWPLQNSRLSALSSNAEQLLKRVLRSIPFLTVDRSEQRSLTSVGGLDHEKGFWTIEGSLYKSSEEFIRRMPSGVSLAKLASLSGRTITLPEGDIVSGDADNPSVADLVNEIFEVDVIDLQQAHHQATLHWRLLDPAAPVWRSTLPRAPQRQRVVQLIRIHRGLPGVNRVAGMLLQKSADLRLLGSSGENAFKGGTRVYLFEGNDLHQYIGRRLAEVENGVLRPEIYAFELTVLGWLGLGEQQLQDVSQIVEQLRVAISAEARYQIAVPPGLIAILEGRQYRSFDPSRGERGASPFANWQSPWN